MKRNWFFFLVQLPKGVAYKINRYLFLKKNRKEQFAAIYRAGGFGDSPSLSGSGSSLESTESIRRELPKLIARYSVKTFLDIPCGDFFWMQHVDLDSVTYIGGDIVEEIVKINEREFGSDKRSFRMVDLAEDDLPRVDLIMCRDCLIHLKFKDILAVLANLKKSGSKYLLMSTYLQCTDNRELGLSFWRPLNLKIAPFSLGPPLEIIDDRPPGSGEEPDKCLGLWRVKDLPDIKLKGGG